MCQRKIIIGILALVVCGVLAMVFWPEKQIEEPVYEGKKLSEWIDQIAEQRSGGPEQGSGILEATQALDAIGTNAIPCYLHWMSYEPSVVRKVELYARAIPKRPSIVSWTREEERKFMLGFYSTIWLRTHLRERGAAAIPQLLVYAKRRPNTVIPDYAFTSPKQAIETLAMMGRPGMTAYLSLVTNEDARVRAFAIGQAERFPRSSYQFPEVSAQFRKAVHDPDFQVRVAATNTLQQFTRIGGNGKTQ